MSKLKHFFGLDGDRVDESRYFKANGVTFLLFSVVLQFAQSTIGAVLAFIVFVLVLVVLILTSIERLKDIGKSPWLVILLIIPVPFIIYLLLVKGKHLNTPLSTSNLDRD